MKKLIVLLGLIVCTAGICGAQTKGLTYGLWFQTTGGNLSLNRHGEFGAIDVVLAPGYSFNRSLFVRAQFEGTYGLWDRAGEGRTYRPNVTLGPTVGCNVAISPLWGIVEFAATAGNSLYNRDWSYLYYDLGAAWVRALFDDSGSKTRLLLGLGVRYYDSHNSRFDNYCNLYVKIGFRFN